jgi:TadE-like protein
MIGQANIGQHPRRRACGGTATVEFVLILPLLLVVFALVFDGGRMLADYHAVSKSVRDATRFLARTEAGSGACTPRSLDRGRPNVASAIRLVLTGRIDGDPATDNLIGGWRAGDLSEAATGIAVSIECLNNAGAALDGLYAGVLGIPLVTIRARVPFRFGPARALGLGPGFSLNVAHKSALTGV